MNKECALAHSRACGGRRTPARLGDHIKLAIDPEKVHVFDKETELTITN